MRGSRAASVSAAKEPRNITLMPPARDRTLYGVGVIFWAAAVSFGSAWLWAYKATPGDQASPPHRLPAESGAGHSRALPTLVVLIHPRCPCSHATIAELARLMADCRGKLTARVLMLRPAETPAGWERTDLWDSAAAIPGVSVESDPDGTQARRFGAATSGQALLYADGQLLFSGGLTESRGHQGENAGRSAVAALVCGTARQHRVAVTPVYGCAMFADSSQCQTEGNPVCHE
jgi:hypothetical protein